MGDIKDALVVPLGAAVAKAMRELVVSERLDERRVLLGFPHPSGLNTRGPRFFAENRAAMRRQVDAWFRRRRVSSRTSPRTSPPARASRNGSPDRTASKSDASSPAPRGPSQAPRTSSIAALPGREFFQAVVLEALGELGGRATRPDIKRRAVVLGRFTPDHLRVPPPPSKRASYPNAVAYQLDWAMMPSSAQVSSRAPRARCGS